MNSRARAQTLFATWPEGEYVIELASEAAEWNEDRFGCQLDDGAMRIALADGAGGLGRGSEAATAVTDAWRCGTNEAATTVLATVDAVLDRACSGQASAVLIGVRPARGALVAQGASVGDSHAWLRTPAGWVELTETQHRRPLVGSGRARPVKFGPIAGDILLVASDGVTDFAPWRQLLDVVARTLEGAASALIDLARLPTGRVQDDASVVVVRPRSRRAPAR